MFLHKDIALTLVQKLLVLNQLIMERLTSENFISLVNLRKHRRFKCSSQILFGSTRSLFLTLSSDTPSLEEIQRTTCFARQMESCKLSQ